MDAESAGRCQKKGPNWGVSVEPLMCKKRGDMLTISTKLNQNLSLVKINYLAFFCCCFDRLA